MFSFLTKSFLNAPLRARFYKDYAIKLTSQNQRNYWNRHPGIQDTLDAWLRIIWKCPFVWRSRKSDLGCESLTYFRWRGFYFEKTQKGSKINLKTPSRIISHRKRSLLSVLPSDDYRHTPILQHHYFYSCWKANPHHTNIESSWIFAWYFDCPLRHQSW